MTDTTEFQELPEPMMRDQHLGVTQTYFDAEQMHAYLLADRASRFPARELSDAQIIEIRDALLPSQGESFDTLAFVRAAFAAAHSHAPAAQPLTEDAWVIESLIAAGHVRALTVGNARCIFRSIAPSAQGEQ